MSFKTFKFLKYDYIKLVLKRLIYSDGMNPLQHSVVFAVAFLFFVDGMTMTTVFSYLPKLVKSFGASEVQAGRDAGFIASSLFLTKIISSVFWGLLSDKFDKKKLLLISSTGLAISTFAFGFSRSFIWALVTRLLQGLLSGVMVISKTILLDICDDTNLSLGFSILFSGFNFGLIIGPSLSGALVFPEEQYPKVFSKESFFAEYAIFLPNLIITICFVLGIVWAYFSVPTVRSTIKHEKICLIREEISKPNHNISETSLLLVKSIKNILLFSSIGRILRSKESLASVVLFGVYGVVGLGYREIAPVFLATALKYGGVGMAVYDIGILMFVYSAILFIVQIGTSKLQFLFGAKKTFIGSILIFAFMTPLIPLSALIQNSTLRWIFLIVLQVFVNATNNICFICINIFLGNSVELDFVGTVNGLGMSVSCAGGALGPTILGLSYSWSLANIENHRLGFPFNQYFVFFLVSIFCLLNLVYVYFLIPTSLNKRKVLQ